MLLVSGFGAHRALAPECGLHVLDPADDDRRRLACHRARACRGRTAGRPADGQAEAALKAALHGAGQPSVLVRRYRAAPRRSCAISSAGWRSGRLDAVLGGDFDLMAAGRSRAS